MSLKRMAIVQWTCFINTKTDKSGRVDHHGVKIINFFKYTFNKHDKTLDTNTHFAYVEHVRILFTSFRNSFFFFQMTHPIIQIVYPNNMYDR